MFTSLRAFAPRRRISAMQAAFARGERALDLSMAACTSRASEISIAAKRSAVRVEHVWPPSPPAS